MKFQMRLDFYIFVFTLGPVPHTVGSRVRRNSVRRQNGGSGEADSRSGETKMNICLISSVSPKIVFYSVKYY